MENKKILGKIIPAALVLVLALLLVITISSCSKGKKTPTGAIEDKNDYLKIDIANDKSYTVSKLEFYNQLRYVGYDVFEDALFEAALSDIVTDIKADLEANSSDLTKAKYYKKFKYVIDTEVYGTADQDEIDDLDDKEKTRAEKNYLNNVKQIGYTVDDTQGIYQKASMERQTIVLAKREYARSVLLKEIDEEDNENKVSDKKITDFYDNKVKNREDFSALLILFSSQTEIEDTLRMLHLKFVGNKLYRVFAEDATYETDSDRKYSEYTDYYKDFDPANTEGLSGLSDNEVLFELCRIYNYVYSYRPQLKLEINGTDYANLTNYPIDATHDSYTEADYEVIKNTDLSDMIALLIAQDQIEDKEDIHVYPRLNYDYKTITDMDSSLGTAMYQNYLLNSVKQDKYNTPSSTFARGNYLVFKLADANESTYKSIKALVELQEAVKSNADAKSVNAFLEVVKDAYADKLKALKIYDDNAKVKAWALDYADTVTAYGLTGAKAIYNSTKDRDNEDSIWSKVFEAMLTPEYIQEKLSDYLDDDCKVTIYDSLFEAQFAQEYDFYKQGNKTSKTNVLKIKVNDKENVITAADMFERLEKKYGANVSANLLLNQIVKEKYYDQITEAKKKEYEKQYEQVITYFASGQSSEYGYTPAIGQKNFINLYFHADSKDDAIFNMWVSTELQNILIYDNPTDILGNILESFQTLTTTEQNNYVNVEYNQLYIYTDDDEDGEPDDWTNVPDDNERKKEVMELSAKLINILNERAKTEYSNDNRESAYNNFRSRYQAASRISEINAADGDSIPLSGFSTTSEQDAYYFAKFKASGLFLEIDAAVAINSLKTLRDLKDTAYEEQVRAIYQYMIANHSSDLTVDQIVARQVTSGDSGVNIDEATETNLFEFEKGFATFYVYNTSKAPVFKFEVSDNSDTSSGGKVYPYSTNKDDPFPTDDDGKPIDNTGKEDSLYNTLDTVSLNQLLVYIREYKAGVESLSTTVIDAFTGYVEEDIVKTYVSETFRTYIAYTLINKYIADGKITIDSGLKEKLTNFTKYRLEAVFEFDESEFTTEWFNTFKVVTD